MVNMPYSRYKVRNGHYEAETLAENNVDVQIEVSRQLIQMNPADMHMVLPFGLHTSSLATHGNTVSKHPPHMLLVCSLQMEECDQTSDSLVTNYYNHYL